MIRPTKIGALLVYAVAIQVHATTITVINTNDSGPGSLRQALVDAHDGDTIDFDPSLKGQTISLTSAELVINKSITISGLGPNLLAVSRAQNAPAFRIFNLMPGRSVTIQGLTISNGLAPEFGCGGGILDEGSSLSLINCTVSGNSTDGTGGGICADANATLTIDSSTLSGNYAGDYGGGIANSGTLTINNSTLSGNRGEFAAGAILNGFNGGASLTVSNSTLSGNTTQLHGGGIFNGGQSAISNSTLSGNSGMTAGAIFNRLATLDIESTILNRGELGPNISNERHGYLARLQPQQRRWRRRLKRSRRSDQHESAIRSVTKQWRSDLHACSCYPAARPSMLATRTSLRRLSSTSAGRVSSRGERPHRQRFV